jgi:C1A family cysteine protease
MSHFYGWKPDLPDHRDHAFEPEFRLDRLPPSVNLQAHCPPVLDQGELGSCTANAIANADLFTQIKEAAPNAALPSRLMVYYDERALEGTVSQDSGAQIRDGIKTLAQQGACPETEWPYIVAKFRQKPSAKCYADGAAHEALQYQRLDNTNLATLQACLAAGFPFVFGFTVYSSFESAKVAASGVVNLPTKHESVLGGHAVLCIGYDVSIGRFRVMNSWGPDWGQAGYFTIPFTYLTNTNLADDFWTIRQIKD